MNHYRHIARKLLLAVGMGAVLAGPVLAETACPAMGAHVTQPEQHFTQIEQHRKQLHDALKLSAEQEASWKKLTDSEKIDPLPGVGQSEDWSKLTAPERAAKMLELTKVHQERMTEHVAALTAFHAMLSPEQKQTFEDRHVGMHDVMHGKPRHRIPSYDKAPAKS